MVKIILHDQRPAKKAERNRNKPLFELIMDNIKQDQKTAARIKEIWLANRKMSFDWEWIEKSGCINEKVFTKIIKDELSAAHSEIAQLKENYGLCQIDRDHNKRLLLSCEIALIDRDKEISKLKQENEELQKKADWYKEISESAEKLIAVIYMDQRVQTFWTRDKYPKVFEEYESAKRKAV